MAKKNGVECVNLMCKVAKIKKEDILFISAILKDGAPIFPDGVKARQPNEEAGVSSAGRGEAAPGCGGGVKASKKKR